MKKTLTALLFLPLLASAQPKANTDSKPDYPQDYFRNPLDIPILLAGNFGECRPGHFHSGLDIKTAGVENKAVHAAAEGYISRIKMEKGGFGHALYVTHPNGYTTLYAHLNDFVPELQQYLKNQQYERKRWDVDLQLSPSQFPVKKGQQIAWSGNTGASTAPHLHFEIRNTKTEHPLNGALFGFPIVDKIAPSPAEVVFYKGNVYEDEKLTVSIAKKGEVFKPLKTDNRTYAVIKDTVAVPAGTTGIGVNVDDFMDGSDNTINFYSAQLFLDDSLQSEIILDDIGYDETRYINAYADYKTHELQHKWIQCLFQLPGNHLDHIYHHLNALNGKLNFADEKTHKVSIVLTDIGGNVSTIKFYTRPVAAKGEIRKPCTSFYANRVNEFKQANIFFVLDERQLYEDICFNFNSEQADGMLSDKYSIHYPYVPLHHYFDLQMKPQRPVPFDLRNKVVIMYSDGKTEDGRGAVSADNGWYKAAVRNFGTYWLDIDTTAPVITSLQKNGANMQAAKQIAFQVKDDKTSVRTFSGYLDGKWLCFEQHGSSFFYKFDEHCPKGKHELVFKAEDENGNSQSVKLTFVR